MAPSQGPLVLTHVYLLVGCALPLWASLAATWHAPPAAAAAAAADARALLKLVAMLCGVLALGVLDSLAALVGTRCVLGARLAARLSALAL